MEVHAHAVAQAREHAEDDAGDLAPALDHVGGVDEEDVALSQLLEFGDGDALRGAAAYVAQLAVRVVALQPAR